MKTRKTLCTIFASFEKCRNSTKIISAGQQKLHFHQHHRQSHVSAKPVSEEQQKETSNRGGFLKTPCTPVPTRNYFSHHRYHNFVKQPSSLEDSLDSASSRTLNRILMTPSVQSYYSSSQHQEPTHHSHRFSNPVNATSSLNSEQQVLVDAHKWSKKTPTGVSLSVLLNYGLSKTKLIHAANWLLSELQIRLARQVFLLDKAPHGLNLMPSVIKVRNEYLNSFQKFRQVPKIVTFEEQVKFNELLRDIMERHSTVLTLMAKGVGELKKELSKGIFMTIPEHDFSDFIDIHKSLDSFYMARIGIRTLISQHIELNEQINNPKPDFLGIIHRKTSPVTVAKHAIEDSTFMCERNYGDAPKVNLIGTETLAFPYVPSHLYYILFELLKNSMRAVVEKNQATKSPYEPIDIIIADGTRNEDVSVKISDRGGGIPRSALPKIWSYLYTTASNEFDVETVDFDVRAPLAGLGVGLPISKLYARYFGGDLQVVSMEGYGTDAYIHLSRLGNCAEPVA